MPVTKSHVSDSALGLFSREIKTSVIGWGLYMLALAFYCTLYNRIIFASPLDISNSLIWAVKEWGFWLLVTPLAFKILQAYYDRPGNRVMLYLKLGGGVLLAALTYRVCLDHITGHLPFASSVIVHLPRCLFAFATVIFIWHIFFRTRRMGHIHQLLPVQSDKSEQNKEFHYPKTILVNKGHDECLIQVDQIQCISAAGNYVEIFCADEQYLMRATMKQIEEILQPEMFLRIHRSYIINIHEISRIKNQPSGNGVVQLRCGKALSISKKYKSQLEQYRLKVA